MLYRCCNWAKDNGMEFNVDKSAYLINNKPFDGKSHLLNVYRKQENETFRGDFLQIFRFLHTSQGINQKIHLNLSASKALIILRSLNYYKEIW